jgi:hypothetical protein
MIEQIELRKYINTQKRFGKIGKFNCKSSIFRIFDQELDEDKDHNAPPEDWTS